MASGKIINKNTLSGTLSAGNNLKTAAVTSGSGTTDHSRLTNRAAVDQHPIEAITGLQAELNSKLDSKTALPLIEEATKGKAKGLYFDAKKELNRKAYWYLTSEVDPVTKMGTKDSVISGPYDLGMGGGSGGGTGITTITIQRLNWPAVAVVGATTKLTIRWSSVYGEQKEPTGNGTIYLTVNNKQVEVLADQPQGELTLDVSKYLIAGANSIQIKIIDAYGSSSLTVATINAVTLELKSSFNPGLNFSEFINYTYIPYGDVEKKVYFIVDGEEKGTQIVKSTGESQTFKITGLTHGAHTLKVYFTAKINGVDVTSNSLFYDLVYFEENNTTPIIVSTFKDLEQEQYIAFNIPYRVYINGKNEYTVSFHVNGEEINKTTINTAEQYWNYLNEVPGNYTLEIKCGKTTKTFEVHIKESTIKVTPVEQDLLLALDTRSRNNNEDASTRSLWEDKAHNVSCELTDFNWKSNGWMSDDEGNSVLRVSGDARIKIPFEVFKEDFKNRGRTIELEIATSAVRNYSTTLISCLDKQSTDFFEAIPSFVEEDFRKNTFKVNLNIETLKATGITPGTHVVSFNGSTWMLDSEVEISLADYGISISSYEINPEGIYEDQFVLNGDNIKINYTLAARGFYVTPQVAVFRSQQSLISTQYKEDEHVRISFVIERNTDNRIIWMYINGIASGAMQYPIDDNFRQLEPNIIEIGSNDAVLDIYNIRVYENSLSSKQIVNNWIADTQSAITKAARYTRNDNYNDKNELVINKLPSDLPYIIWDINPLPQFKGDKRMGNARYVDPTDSSRNFTVEVGEYNVQGTSSSVYPTKNIRLRMRSKNGAGYAWYDDNGDTIKDWPITYPGGIGANYFTFKVDYASSEGANNVELTKLYNDAAKACDIYTPPQRLNSKVRVGIDGFPIAAFHRDSEGKDYFLTKANFNNDKANEDVYGFADGDESWETTNNSADETKYKVPVTVDNFSNGFEIRFPDEDGYNDMSKLGPMTAWVVSTNREAATNEALPAEVTYTYDEVSVGEDGSETTKKVTKTFTHDTADYRLAKFRAELENWFNVDSTLFYYVFTHLYLMIDSRAKNAFPTYFKSRQAGDGGDRWFWIPYDMDTAIGIDNKGKLSFDYNLEDIDQLDGADVFNGQDSVLWCNVRDGFKGEVAAMYAKMRLTGLVSYEETEKRFEAHQGKWSENIFNEDSKNKYITPLANGDNYLEMLQGSKAQQRKWWLYNRFKYMDSKYNAGEAIKDFVQFRAYVDEGMEKPNITITPYADIYATVSYANGRIVAKRAKRNEPIIIENPFITSEKENDQETYIYSASQLKSIGDISGFRPDTVKIGNAIKLQELKVGDKDPNYQNPYLKELTVGNNMLLKSLDARNCVNLGTGVTTTPDISKCVNIEEIYFSGTQIKGITLPDGGNIKKLHLPATLTSLTIKNQPLLNELILAGTENIETLWLENIPATSIKSEEMVSQMKNNTAVRLIGINETYETAEQIKHFYDILDTKKGLAADGETVNKAQVTGTINIDTISYVNYTALVARYPEVKINAKQIICTVIFKNEGAIHETKNISLGNTISAPNIPEKASTQAHYYKFENWIYNNGESIWTSETIISSDLVIEAVYSEHLREYTVTFDARSELITVDPESITITYGSTLAEPILTGIPEGVTFDGWYTEDGDQWLFESDFATTVTGNITLYAKWLDYNTPQLSVQPINYNTFKYEAYDNLGIVGWALVKDSDQAPTSWNFINAQIEFIGNLQIHESGEYYFWVTDSNNNIIAKKVTAYPIIKRVTPGITKCELIEQEIIVETDFAFKGTTVVLNVEMDSHYENLNIKVNEYSVDTGTELTIEAPTTIEVTCTPKNYVVTFELFGKGDPEKAKSQIIIYNNLVSKPAAQYHVLTAEAIDNWYLDPNFEIMWDFETSRVDSDITLYAKWVESSIPTKLLIEVPDGDAIARTVTVNYSQFDIDSDHKVTVEWGDGNSSFTLIEGYATSVSHTYNEGGIYTVDIWGPGINTDARYLLGGGTNSTQILVPSSYIKEVEFAWEVTELANFALSKSSITSCNLTDYMTTISANCYSGCLGLTELSLPENIIIIKESAFRDCVNIKGNINLPTKLEFLGTRAFSDCSSIAEVSLLCSTTPTLDLGIFLNCTGLTKINISEHLSIPEQTFMGCTSLAELNLKVKDIGFRAFSNCTALSKVNIIANNIQDRAFENSIINEQLDNTVILDVNYVGGYVFSGCTGLSNLQLLNKNMTVGNFYIYKCARLLTAGPLEGNGGNYNIEFTWDKFLPDYAFQAGFGEAAITEITLPNTIESIGTRAFTYTKFSSINLPYSLKSIGEQAFLSARITSLEIPALVTSIGARAFAECSYLSKVIIWTRGVTTPVNIPSNAWFLNTKASLNIQIPAAIVETSQEAYGPYWDVYRVSGDTITRFNSYSGFDDENI